MMSKAQTCYDPGDEVRTFLARGGSQPVVGQCVSLKAAGSQALRIRSVDCQCDKGGERARELIEMRLLCGDAQASVAGRPDHTSCGEQGEEISLKALAGAAPGVSPFVRHED